MPHTNARISFALCVGIHVHCTTQWLWIFLWLLCAVYDEDWWDRWCHWMWMDELSRLQNVTFFATRRIVLIACDDRKIFVLFLLANVAEPISILWAIAMSQLDEGNYLHISNRIFYTIKSETLAGFVYTLFCCKISRTINDYSWGIFCCARVSLEIIMLICNVAVQIKWKRNSSGQILWEIKKTTSNNWQEIWTTVRIYLEIRGNRSLLINDCSFMHHSSGHQTIKFVLQ